MQTVNKCTSRLPKYRMLADAALGAKSSRMARTVSGKQAMGRPQYWYSTQAVYVASCQH